MARKGESKITKRLAAPKVAKIKRKGQRFVVRPSRGPHSVKSSIPLTVAARELLGIVDNVREMKAVLNEGKVMVDGKVVRDHRLPVGFMDVISFPTVNKYYRVLYDAHGRLEPREIDAKQSVFKLCRIRDKTVVKGGKTQLNLHDGKNILYEKKCAAGDVVKVELPTLRVMDYYPLTEGSVAYVTGGKHAGDVATIKSIAAGTQTRKPLAVLEKGEKTFETRKDYVFVLGVKEPAIKID
ncbi:MAG: 30S ribosomal protein S4e [Candidatus Diapherotrites archaeon]|nr:30S ribosomal protein S4e [Candidatus Diapherotrites archaeon]